jgi:hypothetical protein
MKEVARYQFFFNSFKGIALDDNPSGAYFKVLLNRQLTLTNPDNQFVLTVEKVTIPVCFNQFALYDLSSVLPFRLHDSLGFFYTSSISIPNGNYSISDMGNTLAALLSANLNDVPSMSNASINWRYNHVTNKFSLQLIADYSQDFDMRFTTCAITNAIGFTNLLDTTSPIIENNGPFVSGDYNINMNPIPEIYVVSDTLSDSNSFQCNPVGFTGVQTTATGVIAAIQLKHSPPFYVSKEFTIPTAIPLDRTIIDFIDLDLRDYNGNILNDFDQPWFISFSITEYNNDTVRAENLRTYINVQPTAPLSTVGFLGSSTEATEQPVDLVPLQKQLQESLEKLKTHVQKRKSTASIATTVSEGTTGTVSTSGNDSTSAPSNTGETEQTTIDSNAAKRQRET